VALFVPDAVRETFQPTTEHGGHDAAPGETSRALRYLEWTFDPDPTDTTYTTEFAFLLRERDSVRAEHDHHTCGLFARADWLRLMSEAGFVDSRSLTDSYDRLLFLAARPTD
jgi:hypothetical protein